MRRRLAGLAAALALALVAPAASAAGAGAPAGGKPGRARRPDAGKRAAPIPRRTGKIPRPQPRKAPAPPKPAVSIGSPTDGRLAGGIQLEGGQNLRLLHPGGARWGLPRLVALLERAARKVEARFDGSVMLVGDLSRAHGGDIGGHHSHESGRDADVGFYYADGAGRPAQTGHFHHVRWDGRAADKPSLRFDDARNWALVQAWVTDPGARVQHIFVAAPLRTRLLVFARSHGVYLPVLQRAAIAMKQPRHALPHDDHFHVRIACPSGQRDVCVPDPEPLRAEQARQHRAKTKRPRKRRPPRSADVEARHRRHRGGA
jgi:penicillin-insensitive murein endopeptidase